MIETMKNPTLNIPSTLRSITTLALATTILLFVGCGQQSRAADYLKAAEVIESVQDRNAVVSALHTFEEMPVLKPYFGNSYGFAIFPTIGKGGMGIGGARGHGWVFGGGQLTGQTTLTQVTIGFQLGGQAFSQIIFFEDKNAFDTFTQGNFELGAQASAVALTAGASAQAETSGGVSAGAGSSQAKRNYTNGIAIFTVAKGGLMYEASVGGQKFTYRPMAD